MERVLRAGTTGFDETYLPATYFVQPLWSADKKRRSRILILNLTINPCPSVAVGLISQNLRTTLPKYYRMDCILSFKIYLASLSNFFPG